MHPEPSPAATPAWVLGIGASAGGVEALSQFVSRLPADFAAAIVVVLHLPAAAHSELSAILGRAGRLPAHVAADGEPLLSGQIVVAPPDRHVIVEIDRLRVDAGPRVNGHRPAIDASFSSMARAFGPRAIAVLLSGTLDDGSRGMFEVGSAGGATFVQDPEEARYTGMIASAMRTARIDAVLPIDDLVPRVVDLVEGREPPETDAGTRAGTEDESPTRYTCPDCGGVLWRRDEARSRRYVCSVGHAYSPESLTAAHDRSVEAALWAAARILGDRHTLLREMADRAERHGRTLGADRFRAGAAEAQNAEAAIRELIEGGARSIGIPAPEDQ